MSPVPNRDPHDRTFSSTYMRSYYPNSRSGTPVFSSGLNNSLHAAPSRPTTSLGKGPDSLLAGPYIADADPSSTLKRRNAVVGCWGSHATFNDASPSLSINRPRDVPARQDSAAGADR